MYFSNENSQNLFNIIKARRDIRGNNFVGKKIRKKDIKKILEAAMYAPSVGYSQPWKFVLIENKDIKNKIHKNFTSAYEQSKKYFKDRGHYSSLKLEGIKESPLNIALFYKKPKEKILGQTSQKKMGEYSVVCAVQNMWLMARSLNIGIGWVSILDKKKVHKVLNVDKKDYKLVAYLCIGYVKEFLDKPELLTLKWQKQKDFNKVVSWV